MEPRGFMGLKGRIVPYHRPWQALIDREVWGLRSEVWGVWESLFKTVQAGPRVGGSPSGRTMFLHYFFTYGELVLMLVKLSVWLDPFFYTSHCLFTYCAIFYYGTSTLDSNRPTFFSGQSYLKFWVDSYFLLMHLHHNNMSWAHVIQFLATTALLFILLLSLFTQNIKWFIMVIKGYHIPIIPVKISPSTFSHLLPMCSNQMDSPKMYCRLYTWCFLEWWEACCSEW